MKGSDNPLGAGLSLFNAGAFWHAHEAWEHGWRTADEPHVTLYKGLIQAAAALVHWQRGNSRGLQRNWSKARPRLLEVAPVVDELYIDAFILAMDRFTHADGVGCPVPRLKQRHSIVADEGTRMVARILVVEDEPAVRDVIRRFLMREGYTVITANDGLEAIDMVHNHQPDLILMDVTMPRMDGFAACRQLKDDETTALIPITMLTGLDDHDHRTRGIEAGADDFLTKPFDHTILRARIRSQLRIKKLTDQLEHTERVIFTLAQTVEAKDAYTEGHLIRIKAYSEQLAAAMGLSFDEVRAVRYGGILHDIGKIGISDTILLKPGPLTQAEYELMKQHPVIGAQIVSHMRFAPRIMPIIRGHHERWDGSGYPDQLRGDEIPIGAQIISVVDAYDAMTTTRPYKRARTMEESIEQLLKGRATQFAPDILDLFLELLATRQLVSLGEHVE